MSEPAARPGTGERRSALLVSGSIGMGHDALAAACAVTLEARGLSTQTLDAMRLLGRGGNSAGERVFRAMLAVPGLFDAFHFAGAAHRQQAGPAGRRGGPPPAGPAAAPATSTSIPPTWPSRCSPPAPRRSARSPAGTRP